MRRTWKLLCSEWENQVLAKITDNQNILLEEKIGINEEWCERFILICTNGLLDFTMAESRIRAAKSSNDPLSALLGMVNEIQADTVKFIKWHNEHRWNAKTKKLSS